MYVKFTVPRFISEISKLPFNASSARPRFPIGIIDNEEFPYAQELRSHGFSITELGDIRDFAAVAEYPIIACDIKDVGAHFGAEHQGAHVAREIRSRYPAKFIIVYSGGTFGPEHKRYWEACDLCLRRDGGFEQWIDALDAGIRVQGNPLEHWKRIRNLLARSDIRAFEIFLLEDAYIRSIRKEDPVWLERAIKDVKRTTVAGDLVDSIAGGLITSVKVFISIVA